MAIKIALGVSFLFFFPLAGHRDLGIFHLESNCTLLQTLYLLYAITALCLSQIQRGMASPPDIVKPTNPLFFNRQS